MSRVIEPKVNAEKEADLMESLLKWAAAHDLSPADLIYITGVALYYSGAASGVAGARVRARARVNKRGRLR
jgi:hypothetical protein